MYTRSSRLIAGALVAASRASLPFIFLRVLFASDPPITPPILFALVATLTAAPALAAWLMARAGRAEVEVGPNGLKLSRPRLEIEFPAAGIERLRPWRVPLPGPGLWIGMRSGRLATYGIQIDDPGALIASVPTRSGAPIGSPSEEPPLVAWARARAHSGRPSWLHRIGKFGLFALPVALILFNAHQHIAYGGFWGQYYQEGIEPYLRTALVYLATVVIYLVLYASVLRGIGEAYAIVSSHLAPTSAATARRIVERFCALAYYLGVPTMLALRFRP